jgi:hypothetical protein
MTDGGESYGLFLNSFGGSAYTTTRNTVADVNFLINWDSFFNGDNNKYKKCRLRYDFISDSAPTNNPFTPTANNGVLILNGINPSASYTNGGMPLGLIDVQSITATNTTVHQSVFANNFIGTIAGGSNTLTIVSASSPTAMLNVGDVVGFRDPNAAYAYTTRTISALPATNNYTYTFSGTALGATAVTAQPFSVGNPYDVTYTSMISSNLQSGIGVSIEVPKGYRNLNVQLQNNNYGQVTNGVVQSTLLTGTNLQEWGLMLIFELYDAVPNDYTYINN